MEDIKVKRRTRIVFTVAICFFYLFFTRLILKSDDGNFLGIINSDGFHTFKWLAERYATISGRSICEFLTVLFLKLPLIFWKGFSVILWISFFYIVCKIAECFGTADKNAFIFVGCVPFIVVISCLNPAVFWFSGSFTYMIPFQCFLLVCSPMLFRLSDIRCRPALAVISCLAAPAACSQEQSAALTLTFSSILLVLLLRVKKARFYHFIPFVLGVAETCLLFSSPGMRKREVAEAMTFPRFSNMNVFEKTLCGISNWFGFEYLMSFAVLGLFLCLLIITLRQDRSSAFDKRFSGLLAISSAVTCFGLNTTYIILRKKLPDKGLEEAFQNGNFHITDILLISACFLLSAEIVIALLRLIAKNKKNGTAVLLCFAAAMCSGTVLGFSSSIYASGQRVFYYSEMLILIACVILFSGLTNERIRKSIRNSVLIFAFIIYMIECLTFFFIETPIMG